MDELKKEIELINNELLFNMQITAGCDENGNTDFAIVSGQRRRGSNFIPSIRDGSGKLTANESEKRYVVREQCFSMFSALPSDSNALRSLLSVIEPLEPSVFDSLLGVIRKEEVLAAIEQLNNNKTPGLDGLPAEFYKLGIAEVNELLTSALNSGLEKGVLCESFYFGLMCLLYKKGDKSDINNYRQLTIMNVDYKILAKIIMNRLEDILDKIIVKEQTCAIKGRQMWDNLCTLREVIYSRRVTFLFLA